MFKTSPLSSFKFPSLHQPLPLSKKEADHLLVILTQSFRGALDREHGSAVGAPKHDGYRPTDLHLRGVLSNPVFAHQPGTDPGLGRKPRAAVFDEAVARGLMTIPRAHGFLIANQEDARLQGSHASQTSGMAASGAGRRVMEWLQASGRAHKLDFVSRHSVFTRTLVLFMLAEGLDDMVWSWLDRLLAMQPVLDAEELTTGVVGEQAPARLMLAIVLAKSAQFELHEAFAAVLRGQKMLDARSVPSVFLRHAWDRIEWKATVQAWRHKIPRLDLFDPFLAMRHRFGPKSNTAMQVAHLHLHHPSHPTAKRAVAVLNSKNWNPKSEPDQSWLADLQTGGPWQSTKVSLDGSVNHVTKFKSMVLDTVQLLSRQGKRDQARSILMRLDSQWGELIRSMPFEPAWTCRAKWEGRPWWSTRF